MRQLNAIIVGDQLPNMGPAIRQVICHIMCPRVTSCLILLTHTFLMWQELSELTGHSVGSCRRVYSGERASLLDGEVGLGLG